MMNFDLSKITLQQTLAFAIAIIGGYMTITFSYPQPPFLSGLAFVLIAIALLKKN